MFEHQHHREEDAASLSRSFPPLALSPLPNVGPRRRIFDAMIHTVARRGYDRTTVSRVLMQARLPDAVFTEHFHDKRDCFMQAVDELIGDAEQAALEEFARPGPWHEHVHHALRRLLERLGRRQDTARVVFVEMLFAGPAAQERQRRALALFTSLMEEGRAQARHAHHLPAQTSEAIVGGIASIVHQRVLQGQAASLPSLLGDLTYFALLPYLDRQDAMGVAGLRPAA